jgi:hypothetical protein
MTLCWFGFLNKNVLSGSALDFTIILKGQFASVIYKCHNKIKL